MPAPPTCLFEAPKPGPQPIVRTTPCSSSSQDRPAAPIAGLATVLAALGVAVGSGATFSAQTANPSNKFTAGTLTHTNSKNGVAIVTGSNLKPGDVRTGETTITNTGSLAGTFQLSEVGDTNGFDGRQAPPEDRRGQRRRVDDDLRRRVRRADARQPRQLRVGRGPHLPVHRHARLDARRTPTRARPRRPPTSGTRSSPSRASPGGGRSRPPPHRTFPRHAPRSPASSAPPSSASRSSPSRVLAAATLVPAVAGYDRYVITSGSMTGTYDTGSIVYAKAVPTADLRVGDVITYAPPARRGLDAARHAPHRLDPRGPRASASFARRATPTSPPIRGSSSCRAPRRPAFAAACRTSAMPSSRSAPATSGCSSSASRRCSSRCRSCSA